MHLGLTATTEHPQTRALLDQIVQQVGTVVLGKEQTIRLSLACLLAQGHLLIEDIPGVGKTTLAHTLAHALGLGFQRIQFTSDLLPADILGVSVYDRDAVAFKFHPGPIFAEVVLADEVNRATPKAQSALLEAMEEGQVTHEGETRRLPEAFFVIATQNPSHQIGTFPLPESQLDRFLMRVDLGYPGRSAERALLQGRDRRELIRHFEPILDVAHLMDLQHQTHEIHASEAWLDYLQALLVYSRNAPEFHTGLSPRAGLALLHSAQAWALMAGRAHLLPEDLQAILPAVTNHRLCWASNAPATASSASTHLLAQVAIP